MSRDLLSKFVDWMSDHYNRAKNSTNSLPLGTNLIYTPPEMFKVDALYYMISCTHHASICRVTALVWSWILGSAIILLLYLDLSECQSTEHYHLFMQLKSRDIIPSEV